MRISRGPGEPAPYQQIKEILRREIIENMSPGDRMPSERDLSRRFQTSRVTISRAIAALVREGLLVRRVGCGTFVTGASPAEAGRAKSRSIGLLIPFVHGAFPSSIIRSINRNLRSQGFKAVLFDSEGSVAREAAEIDDLLHGQLDGALVMPVDRLDNESAFGNMIRLGFPIVFVDRRPPNLEADLVSTDNFWASYEAVSKLIKRGRRRIAHFTWLVEWESTALQDRRRGYEQALRDNGIEPDPELVCPPAPFPDHESAYKHSIAYLRSLPEPVDAIFTINDTFCFAAIASCRALGLRIPADIEIASYFDGDVPVTVPIVRIVQDQEEIGSQAAKLLIGRIEGTVSGGPRRIEVKPRITDEIAEAG